MEGVSIGQYRSHDHPKNFAIRVKFSKVTPESIIPSSKFPTHHSGQTEVASDVLELAERKNEEEDKEEVLIHWQEKLFSRKEFEYYGDSLNCVTSLERKYHEDIETIKRATGERPNKRVFTYIDGDNLTILDNSVTLSENERKSVLEEKMLMLEEKYSNMARKPLSSHVGLRRRAIVADEPTEAMKSSHVMATPLKRMQIMVDVSATNTGDAQDERILCTVKIDANGLIVIKPDIIQKEVLKLEVYHEVRSIYEYTLQDASVMITKLQKSQEANLHRELYNRHEQLMHMHVGNQLYPLPSANEIFTHTLCEIVSAKNFEYNSLYVQYFLDLPPGWESSSNHLFGVTQSCSVNEEGVAHFCFPFDFQLQYKWNESNPDDFLTWPILYLQVYSLHSWQRHRIEGYGYCQLPDVAGATCVQVNTWRPKDDDVFSDMRRYFIGGTRELKDWSYVKTPVENEHPMLSKFYFKTVSTGSVVLRINTLLQTKVIESGSAPSTSKWKKALSRGRFSTAVDSLTQVLDAFHRARKRMMTARSTLPMVT